ncbi:MAG: carbohydrate binding domain-containing protein, partial [Clostridia bacterium]|nr:carbohydrate binding domain-containing protein [Clostridia bacterium]
MKRILAILLALMLLCAAVPAGAMVSADNNLIVNGDFEADDGWTLNGATIKEGVGKDGTRGIELYGIASYTNGFVQSVTVEANTDYVISFDYKGAISGLYVKKDGSNIINPWPSSPDWENKSYTFNSGDTTTITVSFNGTEVTDVKYIDNIKLEKVTAPAETVANGDFEAGESGWKLTTWGGTAAINADAAKEGNLGLYLDSGWSNAYQDIRVKANTDYQISFWVKGYAIVYLKSNGDDYFIKWPDIYTDWTKVTYDFNSGDKTALGLEISCGDNSAFVDSVKITEKVDEPLTPLDPENYEYLQLNGVQGWTQEHLNKSSANNGHESNVTATYYLSDQWLMGEATQSIKAVKSSASAQFNCLVNKSYTSNAIACPTPWAPADGVSKVSEYDGVMIAVLDKDGNVPKVSGVQLRVLSNPERNGWGNYQVAKNYAVTADGYMMFPFAEFPNEAAVRAAIDTAQGISFLLYSNGVTEYYFSDFKAYREKKGTDFSALERAVEDLTAFNTDGVYNEAIAAAQTVLNNSEATQDEVDAAEKDLRRILRPLQLPEVNFDEDNIVLSFGAISDIHITGSTTSNDTKKYQKALQILKEQAGGKLDAITINGDFSSDSYNSNIGTAFKTITDQEMGADANVFFVAGNHDAENSGWSDLSKLFTDLAKYTQNDLPSSQHTRGNRHMVINGYHYIGINMMDYWKDGEAPFAQQDLDWLKQELESARADAPGQPIFVYLHAGVRNTTYGSDLYTGFYWASKNIYSYLENYPEVINFGGHVHFPLMDERTIYQKDFTSLNCGSVQYMAIESGYLQSGSKTTVSNSSSVSSGLLLQVDKNNNIKVTRMNFTAGEVIKQPFYISAPDLENETNLLHYNDDYFNLFNTAPTFPVGAMAVGSINGSNINLNFDAATDDDMVHHYQADIKDMASGIVESTKIFSEFYLYSNSEEMPKSYSFKVPYAGSKDFTITLYAVDSMGLRSEPITFDSSAPAKNGWVYEYGKWGFYVDNIRITEQWLPDDEGNWYYVDKTGYRVTEAGLFFDSSDWFYIAEDGAQQYNVWYRDGDTVHYFGGDGTMVTGQWITYEGADYYFNMNGYLITAQWIQGQKGWCYVDETGARVTNAWVDRDGGPRYVDEDGYMATNLWVTLDGAIYYLDGDGQKICNSWIADGDNRRYLGADGAAYQNGWKKIDVSWYYFGTDAYMVTNKWVKDSVGWCYLGEDGRAVTNCFMKDSTGWCYLNASGSMVKNAWVKTDGKWYYLDANGYMVTNAWKKDSKGWVYVGKDGAMLTNAWCKDSKG